MLSKICEEGDGDGEGAVVTGAGRYLRPSHAAGVDSFRPEAVMPPAANKGSGRKDRETSDNQRRIKETIKQST